MMLGSATADYSLKIRVVARSVISVIATGF